MKTTIPAICLALLIALLPAAIANAEEQPPGGVYLSNETYIQLLANIQKQNAMLERFVTESKQWKSHYEALEMCVRITAAKHESALECLGDVVL